MLMGTVPSLLFVLDAQRMETVQNHPCNPMTVTKMLLYVSKKDFLFAINDGRVEEARRKSAEIVSKMSFTTPMALMVSH